MIIDQEINISGKKKVKIQNTRHAESIARLYIEDDNYLMMDSERMKDVMYAVLPWLKKPSLIEGMYKIKEVLEHTDTDGATQWMDNIGISLVSNHKSKIS